MAFQGFRQNTGPIGPPKAETPFGNFPRTPSPPPPTFPSSPREFEAPERIHPQPLPFVGRHPIAAPSRAFAGEQRRSETLPKWSYGQKYIYHDYDAQAHQLSPEVVPPVASGFSENALSARGAQVQDFRRTGLHPSLPSDAEISGASRTMRGSRSDLIFSDQGHFVTQQNQSYPSFQNKSQLVPQSTRSPPLAFQNNVHVDGQSPLGEAQWIMRTLVLFFHIKFSLFYSWPMLCNSEQAYKVSASNFIFCNFGEKYLYDGRAGCSGF